LNCIAVLLVSNPGKAGLCGPLTPGVTAVLKVPLWNLRKSAATVVPLVSFNRQ
jgi:hypothetical protein